MRPRRLGGRRADLKKLPPLRRLGGLRFWFRFALTSTWRDAFGWPVLVGVAVYPKTKRHIDALLETIDTSWLRWLLDNFGGPIGFLIIALVSNAFLIAPYRAYKAARPIKLAVRGGLSGTIISTKVFRTHDAVLELRNRSELGVNNCSLYILGATSQDSGKFPLLVDRFDCPPDGSRWVPFTRWAARTAPHTDDPHIGLIALPSDGLEAETPRLDLNNRHRLTMMIMSSDCMTYRFECEVWLTGEGRSRTLAAKLVGSVRSD